MEEKKRFQKGLLTGLICGALGSFMVVVILGIIGVNFYISSNNTKKNISKEPVVQVEEEKTQEEVLGKMDQIKKIMDDYFLFEVDDEALAEGMFAGMLNGLDDPYSVYYTEEQYNSLIESTTGIYYGIGVTVSQDVKTGIITVVKPFEGSPGYEAGMLPGDILFSVNGEEVTGMDLTSAVTLIKGAEGTTVNISIVREGQTDYIDLVVERRQIEIPTIEYEMLENQIGYIQILQFDEITYTQYMEALAELSTAGMKGLVIDLRDNPGGRLDVVEAMLDAILPEGLLVYTEDKDGKRADEYYSDPNSVLNVPLTILVNGNSASASEIFAGDIQDFGAGTIVGTTTFGKGIVQRIYTLGDGTAVKITVSKYYTHAGRNIHEIGIKPDVEIELLEELKTKVKIEKSEDNQLQKAIEVLMQQLQ
ncbi:MAG: S41 family peptidase [Clostridiales bacterium]|nr:S41 family peptidase [Clostridiales bacterium]